MREKVPQLARSANERAVGGDLCVRIIFFLEYVQTKCMHINAKNAPPRHLLVTAKGRMWRTVAHSS